MAAILSTWGAECDVLKFFIDPEKNPVPKYVRAANSETFAEVVQVDMVRRNGDSICGDGAPCRHIWEKVWRAWVYIAEKDLDKADWFVKIDDDSLLIPANLRRFVAIETGGWNPNDAHWFGHRFARPDGDTIVSGVSSAFSRETVRLMAQVFKEMPKEYGPRKNFQSGRCVDREGATEERTTALCLNSINIHAESSRDVKLRERVLPLGLPFTVTYPRKANTTGWYWHHKPKETPDMERCCAPDMWGSHGYKVASRLVSVHHRLYVRSDKEARGAVGLGMPFPATWPEQERELYELADKARRGMSDAEFKSLYVRNVAQLVGFDVEPSHHGEFWYSWYLLLLRTSLKHNPFFGFKPEKQALPRDGEVQVLRVV